MSLVRGTAISASNQSTCLKTISLQHQQSSYIIYTSIVQLSLKNARVQNRLFYLKKKSHARFQLHQHLKITEKIDK